MAKGAVVTIKLDIDFTDIAKKIGMNVEDVEKEWDKGNLTSLLEPLTITELGEMANEYYMPVVTHGYNE